MSTQRRLLYLVASLVACGQVMSAAAQESAEPTPTGVAGEAPLKEIMVTTSRLREESVQETPIAVSVFSPEQIGALHAADVRGLTALVPNLSITAAQAVPGTPVISLRGFSVVTSDISTEPGIAVYIDGIYQAITAGGLADLLDQDRVEVLRGPQGTLLGKNAAAGAILLTRSRPTGELGARLSIDYGTFDTVVAQGLLNFPIVDGVLAGKFFASYRHRDDYVDNRGDPPGEDTGGQDVRSARAALLFTPTDDFELYLSGDVLRDRSSQNGARNLSSPTSVLCVTFGVCAPGAGKYQVTYAGFTDGNEIDEKNLTANLRWDLGGVTLTSISGYRDLNPVANFDLDSSPFNVAETYDYEVDFDQFSQELRLSSRDEGGADFGGRLAWLVAGYYAESDGFMAQGVRVLGTSRNQTQRSQRESRAIFGHGDFDLTDALTLSLGVRKSWDEVQHDFSLNTVGTARPVPNNTQEAEFDNVSYEAGLQYQFSDTKMLYLRYAEGYRGGGFIGLPSSLLVAIPYNDETSASYELGLKSEWFDRALLLNLTVFDVEYSDLQRTATIAAPPPAPPNTFVLVTDNVAEARTRGVEAEFQFRPTGHFTLGGNLGYLDAEYTDYVTLDLNTGQFVDRSATKFPYAPSWTGTLVPAYRQDLRQPFLGFDRLIVQGKLNWQSAQNVSVTLHPAGAVPSTVTVDAQMTLAGGADSKYSVTLYGQNVGDKHVVTYGADVPSLNTYVFDNLGRTFGVTLNVQF